MSEKMKDLVFVFIMLFLVVTGTFAATYLYSADEVSYDNSNSNLTSNNIQNALDELYTKCNSSTTSLPNNHTCTEKTNIKCKRATSLHTESCLNSYCQSAGYSLNGTITYGNESTIAGVLSVGDAFDCDVNGDGVYDAATERFYYISDYFDTEREIFLDNIAVLLFYSNTTNGVPSMQNVAYNSSNESWHGPVTAIQHLPTTTQWGNISLYKETRQLLSEKSKRSTSSQSLSTFSYTGYSARFLANQEYTRNTNDFHSLMANTGFLDSYTFFLERTLYSRNVSTDGYWFETPYSGNDLGAYSINAYDRTNGIISSVNTPNGVRPAIDVPKSQILY